MQAFKTGSTGLKVKADAKQPESISKQDEIKVIMDSMCSTPVSLFSKFPHSTVFHVWYRIMSFCLKAYHTRLHTWQCHLFRLRTTYVANLVQADREVCVPVQPKHSLSCFPTVVHCGVNGPSLCRAAKSSTNMYTGRVGSQRMLKTKMSLTNNSS